MKVTNKKMRLWLAGLAGPLALSAAGQTLAQDQSWVDLADLSAGSPHEKTSDQVVDRWQTLYGGTIDVGRIG